MSGLLRVEGSVVAEVAHLALLGIKISGTGILGYTKEIKRAVYNSPFYNNKLSTSTVYSIKEIYIVIT